MCGACGRECPVDIDLGRIYLELRRTLHRSGRLPVGYYDFYMRDLEFSRTEAVLTILPERVGAVPAVPAGTAGAGMQALSYVYFPGCQAGASDPAYVTGSWAYLKERFGQEIGLVLNCCGAPAAWAGDEPLHEEVLAEIRKLHSEAGEPIFILACPTCMDMFERYLSEIDTVSVYELMAEGAAADPAEGSAGGMAASGFKLVPGPFAPVSVFDPCSSRVRPDVQKAIRRLIRASGYEISELADSGEKARCCGYGGLIAASAPDLYNSIGERNVQLGANTFVTYCVNCRDSLASHGKKALHIFDLLLSAGDAASAGSGGACALESCSGGICVSAGSGGGGAPESRSERTPPTLSERRDNRIRLKQVLMGKGKESLDTDSADDIRLDISDDVRAQMQKDLVLDEDVARVIRHAVSNGQSVLDENSGEHTAHLQIGMITCWVRYLPPAPTDESAGYRIKSIYSHRMVVDG
jgi:Fe-S oxidoreductase